MLLQTGVNSQFVDHWNPQYKHHTQYWKDRTADAVKAYNSELREAFFEESIPH